MNAIIANVEHANANLLIILVHLKLIIKMVCHLLIVKNINPIYKITEKFLMIYIYNKELIKLI